MCLFILCLFCVETGNPRVPDQYLLCPYINLLILCYLYYNFILYTMTILNHINDSLGDWDGSQMSTHIHTQAHIQKHRDTHIHMSSL